MGIPPVLRSHHAPRPPGMIGWFVHTPSGDQWRTPLLPFAEAQREAVAYMVKARRKIGRRQRQRLRRAGIEPEYIDAAECDLPDDVWAE